MKAQNLYFMIRFAHCHVGFAAYRLAPCIQRCEITTGPAFYLEADDQIVAYHHRPHIEVVRGYGRNYKIV